MKVGTALNMLTKPGLSDAAVFAEHLALGDLAEPLGFDSLWALEHHFTGYAMSPHPLQLLSYFAGRTKRLTLGTAVPGSDAFVCAGCGAHASAAARSGSCCCSGVGSNGTHPAPPKYASTQACASWVETVNFPFWSGLRWV